jgi:hypothetical protein
VLAGRSAGLFRREVAGALNLVSASVNHLSVFAILGEPAPELRLYLPVV